jgi:hypothetical protein
MPNLFKSGLTFKFKNRFFQLVEIEVGADNSFYFLPLQPEAQVGERIRTSNTQADQLHLMLDEIESGGFPVRKISRHPSGYYHSKDVRGSGGNRAKNGLRGARMDDHKYYPFLVIGPQRIENLDEKKLAPTHHIIIELPNEIEPFTVQFAWCARDASIDVHFAPSELLGSGMVVVDHQNLRFRLCIALVNIRLSAGITQTEFPARTFYIVR